jgi:hypothetical protein
MLNYIRIPKQSFPFRGEKGLTKQLNEGLQNTNLSYLNNFHSGHLVYLFPQLTKAMEVLNDLQCRGAIREALDRCFKEIQAKS